MIITDLDNTLLDENYRFEEAKKTLKRLKEQGIPLIIATSKTLGETLHFQKLLDINHPFVVENGGAGYIPRAFLLDRGKEPFFEGEFYEIPLGVPFEDLLDFMEEFSRKYGVKFSYLHSLPLEEVVALTGLPPHLARLAARREWDVPFLPENEDVIPSLEEEAKRRGLRVQKGGIFYHLTGNHSKSSALKQVLKASGLDGHLIIALGDSPNDLEMLEMADLPVLVSATPETSRKMKERIPHLRTYEEKAARGWSRAVEEILKEIEGGEKWQTYIKPE